MAEPSTAPAGGKKGKEAQRRKLLIYGGLAVVMLVVVVMSRRSSASNTAANTPTQTPDSGLDTTGDLGSGAGGIDPSADMGNIDSDLQELSQQIAAEQSYATSPGGADPNIAAIGGILAGFQTPASTTNNTTNVYRTTTKPGPGGGAAATGVKPATLPSAGKAAKTSKGTHSAGLIGTQRAYAPRNYSPARRPRRR